MERIEFIISEFQKCNIKLSQDKADKLLKLYEFLVEYNKNVNLTAITDFEEVVVKHFIDSVLPFSMIDIKENSSFIDVGTGAGFPSIPLMIVRPDLKGTLLEALNKRCVFLEKACELTEVDAKVIHGRAEDYAKEKREAFDFATARAVAAMPVLCEYCIPYVKTGGRFIALKSVNEDETLCEKAVKVLGGKIAEIKDYTITNGDNRRLFIIDKVSQTPTKYPRNPSMIKKKPL
ncbi:16S rRNA methyltransferase GidB [[Eubacterium] siraeum V10Sc8a]|jgi:16S rRNA (guanine527-N7)-methyltransferase|uniref:Ribosomal RNA small subunit methyltransferase G n=1 Tax=[Eubacterium] siraeum V10Sc8a TaxID=717961 RepID=D4MNV8_9FIRM|nr:16S rRNA methyltransferase GidB [[Eubacterium] siraeum V10Sc8a]